MQKTSFQFSEQNFRKSFINDLQGPNSNRFIAFKDISETNSKYRPVSKPDFGKLIDRQKPIVGVKSVLSNNLTYDITQNNIATRVKSSK